MSQQNDVFKICLVSKESLFGLEWRENLIQADKNFKLLILHFY